LPVAESISLTDHLKVLTNC